MEFSDVWGIKKKVASSEPEELLPGACVDCRGSGIDFARMKAIHQDTTKDFLTQFAETLAARCKQCGGSGMKKTTSRIEDALANSLTDDDFLELTKTSAWADVREKAIRLRSQQGVLLIRHDPDIIASQVQSGDNIYEVEINRQDPNSRNITMWNCTCPWGQNAFKQRTKLKRFNGRLCAHALATLFEAHSQERKKRTETTFSE